MTFTETFFFWWRSQCDFASVWSEALKYHLKTHSGDGENGDDYDDGEDYDDIHDYDDFPENIRRAVKQNLRQKLVC